MLAKVAAGEPEAVKRHEDWGRGGLVLRALAQPLEPRDELLVEDANFTIELKRVRCQGSSRRHEPWESPAVITPGSAHELHTRPALVGEHPPAVVLLFVDPAVAVEGQRDRRSRASARSRGRRRATPISVMPGRRLPDAASLALLADLSHSVALCVSRATRFPAVTGLE